MRKIVLKKIIPLLLGVAFILMAGCSLDTTSSSANRSVKANKDLLGKWEGNINIGGQALNVIINFTEMKDHTLSATLDIPQQSAMNLPLAELKYNAPKVYFELLIPNAKAVFDGTLKDNKIEGSFIQKDMKGTFTLTKRTQGDNKEQTEVEKGESIILHTNTGDISGTLLVPENANKVPVVLIIAGSGPTDHNGNSPLLPGKNNSLKMIAEGLEGQGIASLRYDKRGIGASAAAMKEESKLVFDDYVKDAVEWINLLRKDSRFSKIIVLGHSEGSLIGMLASKETKADSYISVAGPGRPAYDVLIEQLSTQSESIVKESNTIIDSLKQGKQVATVSNEVMSVFRPSIQPYLISWFKYDPSKEITKLNCPVLILQGTNDLQVPAKDAELLHKAKPDAGYKLITDMNHVLKKAPADQQGNLAAYSDPTLPLAPGFMDGILGFLKK